MRRPGTGGLPEAVRDRTAPCSRVVEARRRRPAIRAMGFSRTIISTLPYVAAVAATSVPDLVEVVVAASAGVAPAASS